MNSLKTILLLTFVAIFTFSCNNDDDDNSDNVTLENQEKILGTWQFTSSTTNGVLDTDNDSCLTQFTVTFNETQVTTIDKYGPNCEMTDTYINTYSINGNTISITDEGDTYSLDIVTLNDTTLTISYTEDGDVYTETYAKI